MTDDQLHPRRRRRSSISERIQRALHVGSDKKRQTFSPGYDQREFQHGQSAKFPAQVQPGDGARIHLADAASGYHTPTGYSLQDETLPSTLTYSSQGSRLPSTYTPGSSPSVRPAYMATPDPKKKDKDEICSSPTWKGTARKERRATKRLEAERKELEKRLMQLEESQARLENGIYDRQSRRLTKKQPLDTGKRSSSANSERPRSSRSLSAFFSGSRRSSRSRASSANANDRRRSSDHENPGGGPPTLPLSLPERFGTAVSRELASRHGTLLMSNHQLQRSSHLLHHTAAKSDDLRENWKMAEAWQKQNREREINDSLAGSKMEMGLNTSSGAGAQSPLEPFFKNKDDQLVYPSLTNPSIDLDRELFTASLRQDRKPSEIQKPATPSMLRPADLSTSQSTESPTTRVTTARQLHNTSYGENKRPSNMQLPSPTFIPKEKRNGKPLVMKDLTDPSSHAHQKEYKSSPLALNPITTDDSDQKKENKKPPRASASEQNTNVLVPQPLRINFEFARGRDRQAPYPSTSEIPQGRAKQNASRDRASLMGPVEMSAGNIKRSWNPKPIAFHKPKPTAWELRPPPAVIPPLKHPGRKYALSENSPYGRLSYDGQQIPTIITTEAVPVTRSQESVPQIRHSLAEMPASKSTPNVVAGRGHSRSSSGASSYDTADEEVLDTPNHRPERRKNPSTSEPHETNPSSATATSTTPQDSPTTNELQITKPSPRRNPPLAPDGILSTIRRNQVQKPAKQLKKDHLVAKLFVICCHCQYWHDLPSELYAKLACPERIPSESRLVRTFSRHNTPGRRTSFKKAIFGGISADTASRRLTGGKQDSSSNEMQLVTGGAAGAAGAGLAEIDNGTVQSVPLSCCWCGHEMNRSCCQGWTTLVQMRERHH